MGQPFKKLSLKKGDTRSGGTPDLPSGQRRLEVPGTSHAVPASLQEPSLSQAHPRFELDELLGLDVLVDQEAHAAPPPAYPDERLPPGTTETVRYLDGDSDSEGEDDAAGTSTVVYLPGPDEENEHETPAESSHRNTVSTSPARNSSETLSTIQEE